MLIDKRVVITQSNTHQRDFTVIKYNLAYGRGLHLLLRTQHACTDSPSHPVQTAVQAACPLCAPLWRYSPYRHLPAQYQEMTMCMRRTGGVIVVNLSLVIATHSVISVALATVGWVGETSFRKLRIILWRVQVAS